MHQITLLIGREDAEVVTSGDSLILSMIHEHTQKGSTFKPEIDGEDGVRSRVSSDEIHPDEVDDDSPFILKIILDSGFLGNLGDPNLVEPTEIMGPPNKIGDLMKNKKFEEVIRMEVFNMFYRFKAVGQGQTPEQSIRNASGHKLEIDKQLSSINKLSDSDLENKPKNMYEVINEVSSSEDTEDNPKEPSDAKSPPVVNDYATIEPDLNNNESKKSIDNQQSDINQIGKLDSARLPVEELKNN